MPPNRRHSHIRWEDCACGRWHSAYSMEGLYKPSSEMVNCAIRHFSCTFTSPFRHFFKVNVIPVPLTAASIILQMKIFPFLLADDYAFTNAHYTSSKHKNERNAYVFPQWIRIVSALVWDNYKQPTSYWILRSPPIGKRLEKRFQLCLNPHC